MEKGRTFAELLKKEESGDNLKAMYTDMEKSEAVKVFADGYVELRESLEQEMKEMAELKGLNLEDIKKGLRI